MTKVNQGLTMLKQTGFSLIEALLAAGLMLVAANYGFNWYIDRSNEQNIHQKAAVQANEYKSLYEAVHEYLLTDVTDAWAVNANVYITVDQLIGADLLPSQFAYRQSQAGVAATGVSVMGSPYYIVASKDGDDVIRSIISTNGDYRGSVLFGLGYKEDHQSFSVVYESWVAKYAGSDQHLLSAKVAESETSAIGVSMKFTLPVAGFLSGLSSTPPDRSHSLIFLGWPELGQVPGGQTDPDDAGPGGIYAQCNFSGSHCPAGWDDVVYVDACRASVFGNPSLVPPAGADVMTSPAYSVENTNFTLLSGAYSSDMGEGSCVVRDEELCEGRINQKHSGTISVNGERMLDTGCGTSNWVCNYNRTACTRTSLNTYTNTMHIWCCEPR